MLTIARFADLTGLSPSALRFYDRKGLLPPAHRQSNGYRLYAPEQVETAELINSLRVAGIGVADIREFLERDGPDREQLLARWRREIGARLLSVQMASQYLQGLRAPEPQLHLHRWEEPSLLLWFPATAPAEPLPFAPAVAERGRMLERSRIPVLSGGYVRTLELADGRLGGEVGFRVRPRRGRTPAEARVEEVPPTLFATLECGVRDQRAAHRIFRFLRDFSFTPTGFSLERYLPGIPDRYLLMVGVGR